MNSTGALGLRAPRFSLFREIWLPRPRDEVFRFFSKAQNLEILTPSWLRFEIRSQLPMQMQSGALIDYRLRVRGLPLGWTSKITVWEPPFRFIDEQVRGPYRYWVHEHLFEETEAGTTVIDRIGYDHLGGRLINRLLVVPDLEKIFRYRHERLLEIFPG